jgi:hypothetical protein
MMPAQLVNVAEAALGPLPPVDAFLAALEQAQNPARPPPADTVLFGDTFAEQPGLPTGTEKNQKLSFHAAMDFAKVLAHQNCVLSNLDDWMTAFAKWTLSVGCLFDDATQRDVALAQRKDLCAAAGVPVRYWSPPTLKTNVNALALMYKQTGPASGIVPRAQIQFPNSVLLLQS